MAETGMIKNGSPPLLILCRCPKLVSKKLEPSAVIKHLRSGFPELVVKAANQPCKDTRQIVRAIEECHPSALIVGMAQAEECQQQFEEVVAKTTLPPFFVEFVDVLPPASISGEVAVERAALLIGAALYHQAAFNEVPESAIRPCRGHLTGGMSRRSLLLGLFQQRYESVPWIDPDVCVWQQGCRLCLRACPHQAISELPSGIRIDRPLCVNGGRCLTVCPVEAIVLPGFRRSELSPVLSHLCHSSFSPRVIVLAIGAAQAQWRWLAQQQMPYGAGLMPLFLPVTGLLSLPLFLEAFAKGADGVVVIYQGGPRYGCSPSHSVGQLVGLTNRVLHNAGWGGKRALALDTNRTGLEEMATAVKRLVNRLAVAAKPCFRKEASQSAPATNHKAGQPFQAILAELWQAKPASNLEPIHSPASPLGVVSLAAAKCSGCGLCVDRCPTGALARQNQNGLAKFTFQHQACRGCGICRSLCPDKAIAIEAAIQPDILLRGGRIELAAFPVARCPSCHELMEDSPRRDVLLGKLSKAMVPDGLRHVIALCRKCREREMLRSAKPAI